RDGPSLHPHPDFETRRTLDQNGPVRHPGATPPVSGSDLSARVAPDSNESSRHLAADPVRGVTGDLDGPALHIGAQMHSHVAGDPEVAAGHAAADPFDLSGVPADPQLVAGLSLDIKEIANTALPFAQEHRPGADPVMSQCRHHIG